MDTLRVKASRERRGHQFEIPELRAANKHYLKTAQQKEQLDDKIRTQIRPWAKATCLDLCMGMQDFLPREMRDIIYDYVHAHDTIYVGPEYAQKHEQPCESDRNAHYWDVEYVGEATRDELVESWYRSTLFYFYDKAHNAAVVDHFLVNDRWGLSLRPLDFICKVRIDLGPSGNVLHNRLRCCLNSQTTSLFDGLTAPLKSMETLPNHVHFFIRIHTYRALEFACLEGEELHQTVQALVQAVQALYRRGHRFVVQWPELLNLEFHSRTCEFDADDWTKQVEDVSYTGWPPGLMR